MSDMRCSRHQKQTDEDKSRTAVDKSPAVDINEQTQDDTITYAEFEKQFQPMNGLDDPCYANVPASTDNNAVIYSQLCSRDANSHTVAPSDDEYANI